MGEMTQAFKILGDLPKNQIIQYPSGRWGFVGSVNIALLYRRIDGAPLTEEDMKDIQQVGVGFLKSRIKSISFATKEDAELALNNLPNERE